MITQWIDALSFCWQPLVELVSQVSFWCILIALAYAALLREMVSTKVILLAFVVGTLLLTLLSFS
jgi:hypothetical protein